MNLLFAARGLAFAAELLVGSTIILSLAWFASAQKRASARHLIWLSAFGALAALPLLIVALPSATHILVQGPDARSMPVLIDAANLPAPLATSTRPPADGWEPSLSDLANILGAIWLIGAGAVALRSAVSALCLLALRRKSRPFAFLPGDEPKVAARGQECELRISDGDMGPLTWGLFRPVVLLPRSAIHWPRERLQAVSLHELAHVRRRDSHALALARLVCMVYWPNPMVWFAAKSLRREAEMAADDAVLNFGIKPSHYAGELLGLAEELRGGRPAFSGMALHMAEKPTLESRIQSVLSPEPQRAGVTRMDALKYAGLGVGVAAALAFACPSLAQDTAQPNSEGVPPAQVETQAQPAMPAEPAAPPAPAVAATPPEPAAPASPGMPDDVAHNGDHHHSVRIIVDGKDMSELSAADRERIRRDVDRAMGQMRLALSRKPEIQKALAEARAKMEAIRAAQPEIQKALAEAREEIARAHFDPQHFDAQTDARIDDALKQAEQALEATRARLKAHEVERMNQDDSAPENR